MNKKYNYLENIKKDVRNYIKNNIILKKYEKEELEQILNDDLYKKHNITGLEDFGYTCSFLEAEENLKNNFDLLKKAAPNFGYSFSNLIKQGAEICDVAIRCYLLEDAIAEVLNEYDDDEFLDEYYNNNF